MNEALKRAAAALCAYETGAADANIDDIPAPTARIWEERVRTVIAALREPTETMCRAGVRKLPYQLSRECEMIWCAMIDELLAD